MHSRERVAAPALFENTNRKSTEPIQPTSMEVVLSIDPTARFYHYGPQGCKSGWVKGRDWETSITWCERQAWENARMQLESRRPAEAAVELTPGGMYPKTVDAEGHTLHSAHCQAAFSRRDWRCARCCELMHGAAPREGWQRPFFARKLRELQRYFLFPHDGTSCGPRHG